MEGLDGVDAPVYCFLVSNGNRHVIFDLGVRRDWENYPPATISLIKRTTRLETRANVTEILDAHQYETGIKSTDIESVIWSHHHFDHSGDPATFPPSTDLVVGPGVRQICWPGYPTNPDATTLDSDIANRAVRENSFHGDGICQGRVRVGRFDAFDFFGDGSFYLLDAPGHCHGHLCGFARVTVSPIQDSFVLMGADACHHPGILRPTEHLPMPACPGELVETLPPHNRTHQPFFTLSPTLFPDYDKALDTVRKIQELDAHENVFVLLAHDGSLLDQIDFFPAAINDWKSKELGIKTRWLFCKDLETAVKTMN